MHDENSFVTLTYSPENLPKNLSLDPEHTRNFMKRLRRRIEPARVRFFLCGEYGDETFRPHYHASFFGLGQSSYPIINKAWGLGFVSVNEFNSHTAQYVSAYVVKKMTNKDHPMLKGRYPEYVRSSNRPGIGATAMDVVAKSILDSSYGLENGDVPKALKIGNKSMPLGRYLRARLRIACNFTDEMIEDVKRTWLEETLPEVQALRAHQFSYPEGKSLQEVHYEVNKGRIASVEARAKIQRGKKL